MVLTCHLVLTISNDLSALVSKQNLLRISKVDSIVESNYYGSERQRDRVRSAPSSSDDCLLLVSHRLSQTLTQRRDSERQRDRVRSTPSSSDDCLLLVSHRLSQTLTQRRDREKTETDSTLTIFTTTGTFLKSLGLAGPRPSAPPPKYRGLEDE